MKVWVHIVDCEPVEVRIGKNVGEDILNYKIQSFLDDEYWVKDTVNDLFSSCDLYERMKTEQGKAEVEKAIREQAKCEAEDMFFDDESDGWFEVEATE